MARPHAPRPREDGEVMEKMNSKNFNAAQKHFEKKRIALSEKIKRLTESESIAREQAAHYQKLYEAQKAELEEMKRKLKIAMEYAALSEEDLTRAIERDKHLHDFMGMISVMIQYMV